MNRTPEWDVQQIIHMGSVCTELRILPDSGGLFQQDSLKVWLLDIYRAAVAERREKEAKDSERQASQRRR